MKHIEIFELKAEHIKLLTNTYISWNYAETGAPEINPKRPYGNSAVAEDIAEIIGMDIKENEYGETELTDDEYNQLYQLHYETEYALDIVLKTKQLSPGVYKRERFSNHWILLSDSDKTNLFNVVNLNEDIQKIILDKSGHYKHSIIKELEKLGLDGHRLSHLDYETLKKLLERREKQVQTDEERKLDKLIENLLIEKD